MITSVVAGFVVAKMKRPKILPLASCLVCAAAFVLLAGITVDTTLMTMGAYLFILGFGAGLGQQVLVLIVQNEFSVNIVGTATSTNNFFREIGGTIGTSLVGSLFTSQLSEQLSSRLGELAQQAGGAMEQLLEMDSNSLTPALVRTLPDAVQEAVKLAYNDALAPVFAVLVPLFIVAFAVLLFAKNKPLSHSNDLRLAICVLAGGYEDGRWSGPPASLRRRACARLFIVLGFGPGFEANSRLGLCLWLRQHAAS